MKLRPIRKEDLTRKPIVATGSQLVDTIEIDPRDVYIPLLSEGIARNAVRTKLDHLKLRIWAEDIVYGPLGSFSSATIFSLFILLAPYLFFLVIRALLLRSKT